MNKNKDVEIIKNKNNEILAVIIPNDFHLEGVKFFSPQDAPQQLGFMSYKTGRIFDAHEHKSVKREIYLTQEVLMVKKGELRVDFYDSERKHFVSRTLKAGDVIFISGIGGHGFEVLKDAEIIEVKQGPYLGENDKVRFNNTKK